MHKTPQKQSSKEEKQDSSRQEKTITMLTAYIKTEELMSKLNVVQVDDLISTDSYNETILLNKVLQMSNDDQRVLFQIALQVAIIGIGNRNYGKIKLSGEILDMVTILKKYQITYNKPQNSLYKEDELSPRRLTRLFRGHIFDFINKQKRPSYLWIKYSDKDIKYVNICFPGGEYLELTKDEYKYLYDLYSKIDSRLNTNFKEKIERVALARGISLKF